jgi:phosphoenolpyruvate---glycerone phosphotransferase subunit DhaM
MIGIVVVSHSSALAEAAIALADEMVHGSGPVVAVAAGAAGGFGTDATEVRRAIDKAASPDGVLVLMDLGSAVLSAELALELGEPLEVEVRLSPAPVVEGLVAAVVRAAGGADLDTVAREAESALLPKVVSLAEHASPPVPASPVEADVSVRLMLVNPQGLHARPAAQIATAVGGLAAEVAVESGGRRADASSSLELMTLGAGQGVEIVVSAVGADAEQAVAAVRMMVEAGFGELEAS